MIVWGWLLLLAFLWMLMGSLVVVIVYGIFTYWHAKTVYIDNAPREDMFVCDKHGAIPQSTLIDINTSEFEFINADGMTTRAPVQYCPLCFEDRLTEAKTKYGI